MNASQGTALSLETTHIAHDKILTIRSPTSMKPIAHQTIRSASLEENHEAVGRQHSDHMLPGN